MLKKLIIFLWLLVIFMASSWALFRPGLFRVHDYVHGARIAEMTQALQEGQIPVRWSENFGFGYGMPLFQFYAPLPYLIGAFFFWIGLDLINSVKVLFLLANLGTVLGGYSLGKKLYGGMGGVIVASALTLAPYRAVNLFVRGAISEAWGIMFLPWILLGIVSLVKAKAGEDQKKSWVILTLSLVGLMLSHNLVTLMFVPASSVFALVYLLFTKFELTQKFEKLLRIISAYLLALGLGAFYTVPAIMEKGYTQIDSILSGYFHFSHHFLYIRQFFQPNWGYGGSEWGPNDGISFFLGYGQLLGLVVTGVLLIRYLFLRKTVKWSLVITFFVFLGLSLYLSLLKSQFIWEVVPLFNFIQFPWRWLTVVIIFLSLLVGYASTLIKFTFTRYIYMVFIVALMLFNAQYFQPESFLEDPSSLYYQDENLIRTQMSQILPDFIPEKMVIKDFNAQGEDGLETNLGLPYVESDSISTDQIEILVDRDHEKLFRTNFNQDQELIFKIANFPGWQVEVDGEAVSKIEADNGLFKTTVPEGSHLVGVSFNRTPIRMASDVATALSLVILLFVVVDSKKISKL